MSNSTPLTLISSLSGSLAMAAMALSLASANLAAETGGTAGGQARPTAPRATELAPNPQPDPGVRFDRETVLKRFVKPRDPTPIQDFSALDVPPGADEQYCCDASDNCSPLPVPAVCPADTITTWCDEDGNCVDED